LKASLDQLPKEVNIYPNPAHDQLTIQVPEGPPVEIRMVNILGKIMYQNESDSAASENTLKLSLKDFSPGTYFIQIKAGEKQWVEKVIVE
jgi:hypothetical protein